MPAPSAPGRPIFTRWRIPFTCPPTSTAKGIGRRLLEDLIDTCTGLGYRQMVAIIGDSANQPSIGLHTKLGFETIGVQPSVGFKFGRWVDTVTMKRALGPGNTVLPGG